MRDSPQKGAGMRDQDPPSRPCSVKRHGKLRYPVKFPCSLLEFYREEGLQLSYVIQQHEG